MPGKLAILFSVAAHGVVAAVLIFPSEVSPVGTLPGTAIVLNSKLAEEAELQRL